MHCNAGEAEIPAENLPASWEGILPAGNGRIAARVSESLQTTRITASILPPAASPADPFRIFRSTRELSAFLRRATSASPPPDLPALPEPHAHIEIEWLAGVATPARHTLGIRADDGKITSSHRQDRTTIRRTILAGGTDDAIFIHAIADLPGALSLRARLIPPTPQTVEIVDRRQLVSTGEGEISFRAWVLPFESDVEPGENQSIMIRGEGEALIILNLAPSHPTGDWLEETLKRLGERHDPGHWPPNPSLIWQGVLKASSPKP